jgi:phosphate uptake regulator
VRRKVLRYLAIAGTVDLVPGLVLTGIVIDIERIGDYTKNIAELATTYPSVSGRPPGYAGEAVLV